MVVEIGVGWGGVGSTIGDAGCSCAWDILTRLSSEVTFDLRADVVRRAELSQTDLGFGDASEQRWVGWETMRLKTKYIVSILTNK